MDIDTVLGIFGAVTGILGLITGYVFYKLGTRAKEPSIIMKSNNLIRDHVASFDNLEVLYCGHKVKNLTVTRILFWNKGNDTVRRSDITEKDRLRIACQQDILIFSAKKIMENNPSSNVSCELNDNKQEVYIIFDYLDPGNGAIFEIVHTGLSNSDITIKGVIIGARQIKILSPKYIDDITEAFPKALEWSLQPIFRNSPRRKLWAALTLRLIVAILSIIFGSLFSWFIFHGIYAEGLFSEIQTDNTDPITAIVVIIGFVIIFGIFPLYSGIIRFIGIWKVINNRLPRNIDI